MRHDDAGAESFRSFHPPHRRDWLTALAISARKDGMLSKRHLKSIGELKGLPELDATVPAPDHANDAAMGLAVNDQRIDAASDSSIRRSVDLERPCRLI
jgi:hypothetical protein